MRTRVKICGICSAEDARAAVLGGADAVGVVLSDSPRRLSLEEAEEVLSPVPPFVARVGVFVDEEPGFVAEAAARLGLSAAQLHGDEPASACRRSPVPIIKAFGVGPDFAHEAVEPYREVAAALLLDAQDTGNRGGTGKTFAWQDIAELPGGAPLIVAGGLTPANVGAAIRTLRPFAVDVSSGVEETLRHKDPLRIQAFVAAVSAIDEEVRLS